jgi:hypothetical protein
MKRICKNCTYWKARGVFGNCQKIEVGKDVRISGMRLQTNENFSCKYFKKHDNGNDSDGSEN